MGCSSSVPANVGATKINYDVPEDMLLETISPPLPPLLPSKSSAAFLTGDEPPTSILRRASTKLAALPPIRATSSYLGAGAIEEPSSAADGMVLTGLATRYTAAELRLAAEQAQAMETVTDADAAAVSTLLSRRFTESMTELVEAEREEQQRRPSVKPKRPTVMVYSGDVLPDYMESGPDEATASAIEAEENIQLIRRMTLEARVGEVDGRDASSEDSDSEQQDAAHGAGALSGASGSVRKKGRVVSIGGVTVAGEDNVNTSNASGSASPSGHLKIRTPMLSVAASIRMQRAARSPRSTSPKSSGNRSSFVAKGGSFERNERLERERQDEQRRRSVLMARVLRQNSGESDEFDAGKGSAPERRQRRTERRRGSRASIDPDEEESHSVLNRAADAEDVAVVLATPQRGAASRSSLALTPTRSEALLDARRSAGVGLDVPQFTVPLGPPVSFV